MPTTLPPILDEIRYYDAEQEYLRNLPPEHFMESTPHATQRKITLESLDLVSARRPDVQVFSELLVQYPRPRKKKLGQVVPDNMVVVHPEPIKAAGSYNLPFQPVRPFWMLEYVSKGTKRKDYVDNMRMYEHELKVPYYLLFDPEEQLLTLYRNMGQRFARVEPNQHGRFPIKELDLTVAVLDGWVRFWYQGELLALPAELQKALDESRKQTEEFRKQAEESRKQAEESRKQAEESRKQTEESRKQTEESRKQTEESRKQAEESRKQAEESREQAEESRKQAEESGKQAEESRKQLAAAEREIERLRALLHEKP